MSIEILERSEDVKAEKKFKEHLPIIVILAISAFLNIWRIWGVGFANKYYAAGVYSMGKSLHTFFFNSLDSVGFVTIDKPPLGFWIQVLFTKTLGFSGTVVVLPQAIASVLSVYLIYRILKNRFNKDTGLIGAVILTLTPIYVAVSRNNTIDGILILLLVLAAGQALKATEKASIKHLIFAGVLIGLGFNVKMLQAYVIVPAIYLTYLFFAKQKFIKKILVCAVSVIIMVAISLSWCVAVDMIPEEDRPYVGSSEDNSALDLAIGYNGINRIFRGGNIGSGNTTRNQQNALPDDTNIVLAAPNNQINPNLPVNSNRPNVNEDRQQNNIQNNPMLVQLQNNVNQKNSSGGESGAPGITRLYNDKNAGQISWFILPAIFSIILMCVLIFRRKFKSSPQSITMFFFAMCFIPIFIYFSFASGLAHRYYFATLAPFMSALAAIGFYHLAKCKRYWMPIVFIPAALAQLYIQYLYRGWADWILPICTLLFSVSAIVMIIAIRKKAKPKVFILLMCILLIMPAIWSLTPMIYNDNSQLPIAGPELVNQRDLFDNDRDLSGLAEYLEENRDGAEYLVMTRSSMDLGAELILQSDGSVMVLGGFNGGDGVLEADEFIRMVKDGDVRYAVLSMGITNNNKNSTEEQHIFRWIENNGRIIRPMEYGGKIGNYIVYKLS